MLIPVNKSAPPIPIGVYLHDGSNNTFNSRIVKAHWDILINSCIINRIALSGFSSDGAPSNRNALYNQSMIEKFLNW